MAGDRTFVNGRDVTGRVSRVQRVWVFGRAFVLDLSPSGEFLLGPGGRMSGRWAWGLVVVRKGGA